MTAAERAEGRNGGTALLRLLLPVDRLLLGYLTIITVVAVIRAPRQPECWWLLPAHALFVLLLYLIRRRPLGATGQALGEIYPLILLVGLYSEVGILNGHGVSVHDGLVQRWETAIFGGAGESRVVAGDAEPVLVHGAARGVLLVLSDRDGAGADLPAPPADGGAQTLRLRGDGDLRRLLSGLRVLSSGGPLLPVPPPGDWFIDNLPARLVYATLAAAARTARRFRARTWRPPRGDGRRRSAGIARSGSRS